MNKVLLSKILTSTGIGLITGLAVLGFCQIGIWMLETFNPWMIFLTVLIIVSMLIYIQIREFDIEDPMDIDKS